MAGQTPNMNLTTWPNLTTFFNHNELKSNFQAIDAHDHTAGNGVVIPTAGLQANAVTAAKLANGAVVPGKLSLPAGVATAASSSITITDTVTYLDLITLTLSPTATTTYGIMYFVQVNISGGTAAGMHNSLITKFNVTGGTLAPTRTATVGAESAGNSGDSNIAQVNVVATGMATVTVTGTATVKVQALKKVSNTDLLIVDGNTSYLVYFTMT